MPSNIVDVVAPHERRSVGLGQRQVRQLVAARARLDGFEHVLHDRTLPTCSYRPVTRPDSRSDASWRPVSGRRPPGCRTAPAYWPRARSSTPHVIRPRRPADHLMMMIELGHPHRRKAVRDEDRDPAVVRAVVGATVTVAAAGRSVPTWRSARTACVLFPASSAACWLVEHEGRAGGRMNPTGERQLLPLAVIETSTPASHVGPSCVSSP